MELFDEDLVTLPQHLPEWFIDQRRMMVTITFFLASFLLYLKEGSIFSVH
jgi:hypothetical protein